MAMFAKPGEVKAFLGEILWRPVEGREGWVEGLAPYRGDLPLHESRQLAESVLRSLDHSELENTGYSIPWIRLPLDALQARVESPYLAESHRDYALRISAELKWKPAYDQAWVIASVPPQYQPVGDEIASHIGSMIMDRRRPQRDYQAMMDYNKGEAASYSWGQGDPRLIAFAKGMDELNAAPLRAMA